MATIGTRKTSRGRRRYLVRIRLADHPHINKTFGSLEGAQTWARRIEGAIEQGHLLPVLEAKKHSLEDVFRRYVDSGYLDEFSKRHAYNRASQFEWWADRLGNLKLSSLTPATILAKRDELIRTGRSPQTSNRYLAALSAVLDVAVREWSWLESNPCRRIRPKREPSGRVRFLSEDEMEALLSACEESNDPRLHPITLFALLTGARQTELMRIKWQDINLRLDPPRATLNKTKNSDRRVLSFQGSAGPLLRNLSRVQHISGYVFATPKTSGRPRFPRKAWRRAVAAAGLEDFRFHDCRHSAASMAAMSGATLAELAAFLGHRSLASVRRYAHLTEDHTEGVGRRMAEKYGL